MSPVDVKPIYYQEYNLVGETPDILVMSAANDENMAPVVIMPEIVVSAPRPAIKTNTIDFPEIVVSAPRITPSDNMDGVVMMPEIIVTAERLTLINTDMVTKRPSPEFDYSQSSVKYFYLYTLLTIFAVLCYAGVKIFIPKITFLPIFATISRAQQRRHHRVIRK
jgi:hypothetical protein